MISPLTSGCRCSLLCSAKLIYTSRAKEKKKASFSKQNPKRHSAAEYVSFCAWQGCGKETETEKGDTFPLEKQSACNYVCADCVQRKRVPRIRGFGDVAWIVYVCL